MKIHHIFFIHLVLVFLLNQAVIAQSKKDQYSELSTRLRKESHISKKIKITQTFLDQAIRTSDTLNMANAYLILSHLKSTDKAAYTDSVINITRNKNYFKHPTTAYRQKGNIKFEQGDYVAALDFYIKASKTAKKSENYREHLLAKFNIGLLKNMAGDRKDAQVVFANYVSFLEQNPLYINRYNYGPGLFALADSYIHTRDLDLAKKTIDKGIKETLRVKDTATYSYIIVTSGIHQYLLNNYHKAIDSLEKGKRLIRKFDSIETRIATCEYYIGKSYKDLGEEEKSIYYFQETDTILRKTKDVIPEIIDVYNHLRAYAKSQNNSELQIEYIDTQFEMDSIQHANQVYLTRNITRKYDAPELISEKEKLLEQLEKDRFLKNNTITFLIILSAILVLIAIYGYRRSYINKIRFQRLLEQQKIPKEQPAEIISSKSKISKKEDIDIPEEVIETILEKLQNFENKNLFATKHYTLNILAKELHTNSAYLSKIINVYKNVNFANYLNNLRIDFAVNQLRENKHLRSYTIQAIAEEVGFKNAQSFSSAFHKKTGIYPSYFLKHIKS